MRSLSKYLSTALAVILAFTATHSAQAATDYFRLSWRDNPSTTMVVGWRQNGGTTPVVHYGTTDYGTTYTSYPLSATPARTTTAKGMTHSFARLTGLTPDTAYYFVVRDSSGVSSRMWFRTAPSVAKDITYITGGDSRNNRTPRQQANQMVAKLRPLFVLFGGDYTDTNSNLEWSDWFADWQQTKSTDGRMYPIIAARGNHDDNLSLVDMFDIPDANVYFALNIGGSSFMRLYTLNSEITPGGTQGTWLTNDLAANTATKWKIAQYHKPMYPHESAKAENTAMYTAWAQPFYDHAMSLVAESDSHCVKTTWPVRPTGNTASASAFTRDDAAGTVYVGEGCWGAPLRSANDNKTYTRNSASFNNLMWVHTYQDRMELRTIDVANVSTVASVSDSNPFALPTGLNVWNPSNGGVITMYPRSATTPGNVAPTASLTAPASGSSFTAPATITVSANAADSDGTVTSVEFLANGSVIGTDTTSPYSIAWSSVAAGSYTLTARATDNSGAKTTSTGISITVSSATGTTTVAFQNGTNGYTGATDSKIRSDATTTNYGTSTSIEIDGSPDYAGLIRWDLSSIPAGKTVTSATISVNITDVSTEVYEIYALRRAWVSSGVTWARATSTVNWATAGANNTSTDRESTVLGTMSSSTTGIKTFSLNSSGVAKVQSWINTPSSNYGFVIQDYVNNANGLDFSSSEFSTVASRPKLTITYQ